MTESKPKPKLTIFESKTLAPGDSHPMPPRKTVRAPKPRDEQLRRLDAKAAELYEAWVNAGKPRTMDKSPRTVLAVNPEGLPVLKSLIRRVTDAAGGAPGKSVRIRDGVLRKDGRQEVIFAVWDRKAK